MRSGGTFTNCSASSAARSSRLTAAPGLLQYTLNCTAIDEAAIVRHDRFAMAQDFRLFYTWDPSDPPRYHCRPLDGAYFDWLFSMLAGTGLTFLYRCNLAGRAYYPSRLLAPFDHGCVEHRNPDAAFWHRVADTLDGCDPLAEAVRAARRHHVPIWAWYNWNEFQCVRRDWLYLIDPEWYAAPRHYWCSRDGSRFYHGVPDFGNADVRTRLTGLAAEVMGYGVDGFYLSTRSHSWNACWPSPDWDADLPEFGFNDSVVDAYRKRHGLDIRYEEFDRDAWLGIKGEQLSTLLFETGAVVHAQGRPFVVGMVPDRHTLMGMAPERAGVRELQLYKDWETWSAEGSIDGICAEKTCPHEQELAGADISPFRDTLPAEFPVYTWLDTAWYVNRGGGPFSLVNWNRNSVDELLRQIEMARETQAAGAVLHTLYHFTAADSDGEAIGGYGVLPRLEYFEALRELAAR